jgi:hypothetical protein
MGHLAAGFVKFVEYRTRNIVEGVAVAFPQASEGVQRGGMLTTHRTQTKLSEEVRPSFHKRNCSRRSILITRRNPNASDGPSPDWPPKPAKKYQGRSVSLDDAQIGRVIGDVEGRVSFVCQRYGESIPFEFFIWDKKNSTIFQQILDAHPGITPFDLGSVELALD